MKLIQELLALREELEDPVIRRIYSQLRKAYQKVIANPHRGSPGTGDFRIVYKALAKPLADGDKSGFIKVLDKIDPESKEADAWYDLVGRMLNDMGIENIEDIEDDTVIFNALYAKAKAMGDEDEEPIEHKG